MFRNIGKKCKGLALFFFWVFTIVIVIGFAAAAYSVRCNSGLVIATILTGVLCFLLCWVSVWALYAIGEAADGAQTARENNRILMDLSRRIAALEKQAGLLSEDGKRL